MTICIRPRMLARDVPQDSIGFGSLPTSSFLELAHEPPPAFAHTHPIAQELGTMTRTRTSYIVREGTPVA
jgi:hypothetical protein